MDEEIDIEEHNILEDPKMKEIVPDVTKVKTEVTDEAEYINIEIKQEPHDDSSEDHVEIEIDTNTGPNVPYMMPTYLNQDAGGVANTSKTNLINYLDVPIKSERIDDENLGMSHRVFDVNVKIEKDVDTNIPEGTMSNTSLLSGFVDANTHEEHLPASVFVKDYGVNVKDSPCYCDICEVLFPTEDCYDAHRMAAHSFVVAKQPDDVDSDESVSLETTRQRIQLKRKISDSLIKNIKTEDGESCGQIIDYNPGFVNNFYELPDNQLINDYENVMGSKARLDNISKLLECEDDFEYAFSKHVRIKNPPVPKIIFKCIACNLHHLTTSTAHIPHDSRCGKKYNVYNCSTCQSKFQRKDAELHEFQHLTGKSFKVYPYRWKLLNILLCRCPRCNICFSERKFWEHLRYPCIKDFIHCKKCNLHINKDTYMSSGHLNCDKNLVVDFFDTCEYDVKPVTLDSTQAKSNYKLFFCDKCNRCGMIDVVHDCKKRKVACDQCGLWFSTKTILSHKRLHDEEGVDLHNFLLYSYELKKFIPPPIIHKYCKICMVYYISKHECGEFKTCETCAKRFDKKDHAAHTKFHTYNLDKLIKNSLEMGGYVGFRTPAYAYYCSECDCYVHTYDDAVRHSQNHYTNSIPQIIHCDVCMRSFEAQYHNSHKHCIKKYKVLNFYYQKVFTDAWFDMFEGLDQLEMEVTLMDSLYKDTRSVDLSLVQNGLPRLTLYVCSSCYVVVEKTALEKHVGNRIYCWNNRKHKCESCNVYFCSPSTLSAHKALHSKGIKKEDFRFISIIYNATLLHASENNLDIVHKNIKQEVVDDNSNAMVYKCRKCRICFISDKDLFKHHCSLSHKLSMLCRKCKQFYSDKNVKHPCIGHKKVTFKYFESKDNSGETKVHFFNTKSIKPRSVSMKSAINIDTSVKLKNKYVKRKKSDNFQTKVKFYKCANCKTCNLSRKNHVCAKKNSKKYCKICQQWFNSFNWFKHNKLHVNNAEVNITICKFKPKKIVYANAVKTTNRKKRHVSKVKSNVTEAANNKPDKIESLILYKCENCGNCSNFRGCVERHICSIDTRFCKICQQTFNGIRWNRHKAMHVHNPNIKIIVRNFKPQKIIYSKTLKVVDESVAEVYKCTECNKCLLTKKTLYAHRCHDDLLTKYCDICKEKFSNNKLKKHMAMHEKDVNIVVKLFKPSKKFKNTEVKDTTS